MGEPLYLFWGTAEQWNDTDKKSHPKLDRIFCVDRGGQSQLLGFDGHFSEPSVASVKNAQGFFAEKFEPLESVVKAAPRTIRTRPSCPRQHANKSIQKKSPNVGLFGDRMVSFSATLTTNDSIANHASPCQDQNTLTEASEEALGFQ